MTIEDDVNRVAAASVPKGWEPYTEHTEQIGEAIVRLPRPNATEHDLLIGAGFNPDEWQIQGPVNTRKWMRYDGQWLYYYKFNVVAGEGPAARAEHVDELIARIRKRRPRNLAQATAKDAWAFVAADWQLGKREGSVGTDQTAERVADTFDQAVHRVRSLRRLGRSMPHGAILGLGDIIEGCHGNYNTQTFTADRTRRDQCKLARELLSYGIDSLAPLFDRFTVATVAGNHGEHRNDGKQVTDDSDNDDVAVFEALREAYDRGGWDLDWVIPYDELSVALTLGGVDVGITHGHKFGKGPTVQAKALEWFKGQDFGYREVRGCKILISGHFHHFLATQAGQRFLYQAPAMDPGSKHYTDRTGEHSSPGALTLRLDDGHPYGHGDLEILVPR